MVIELILKILDLTHRTLELESVGMPLRIWY